VGGFSYWHIGCGNHREIREIREIFHRKIKKMGKTIKPR
jgi:hypothetical protein